GKRDPEGNKHARRPRQPQAAVEMKCEWAELVGQDADGFESELPFSRFGRRQEQAGFDGDPETFFVLQDAFLDDPFERNGWIDDIDVGVRTAPDRELRYSFPVPEETVVEDKTRNDESILVFF